MRKIAVRSSLTLIKKYKPFSFYDDDNRIYDTKEFLIPKAYEKIAIDEIHSFLDQLPPSLKVVFNMYVVEGYSHKEIGSLLGITDSSSRANLARARAKLIIIIRQEAQKIYKINETKIQV